MKRLFLAKSIAVLSRTASQSTVARRRIKKQLQLSSAKMVLVQQQLSDHIGYNIIHWIISQSGIWYTKFNENIQSNLRTIESGVAVIDEILTPQDDDLLYELNNQFVDHDRAYYYHQNIRLNDNYYVNGNENYGNQLHGNLRGIFFLYLFA